MHCYQPSLTRQSLPITPSTPHETVSPQTPTHVISGETSTLSDVTTITRHLVMAERSVHKAIRAARETVLCLKLIKDCKITNSLATVISQNIVNCVSMQSMMGCL